MTMLLALHLLWIKWPAESVYKFWLKIFIERIKKASLHDANNSLKANQELHLIHSITGGSCLAL